MNRKPDIRYRNFTFPFGIISEGLRRLIAGAQATAVEGISHEGNDRAGFILAWLGERSGSGAELVDVTEQVWGRQWDAMISEYIETGVGTVFCSACNRTMPMTSVRKEQWNCQGEDSGVLFSGGGRSFLCPKGHELFRTEDSFGFM